MTSIIWLVCYKHTFHGQNGKIIFCYNFAQNWYFSESFGTQLIFDMYCAVNSLKVKET